MRKKYPDPKEVKKHWQAQKRDQSIFVPDYRQDKGVSIVESPAEARAIIESEIDGTEATLFKLRNPVTIYADPIARVQQLIRAYHVKQLSEDAFKEEVQSLEEEILRQALYGQMTAKQRADTLLKLAKLVFEAQKRTEDLIHRDRQEERKRQDQLVKATRLGEQLRAAKARQEARKPTGEDQ